MDEASLKQVEKEARALLMERNKDPDERRTSELGWFYPAWHDEAKELLLLRQRMRALGVWVI